MSVDTTGKKAGMGTPWQKDGIQTSDKEAAGDFASLLGRVR
jgi:hypothetical protein